MGSLWIIRIIVLFSSLVFSTIVVGLSINYLVQFEPISFEGLTTKIPSWVYLSVVVAGLSLILLIPMAVVDLIRRGALTSLILVDLIVTSVLSVIWLADAALATDKSDLKYLKLFGLPATCSGLDELVEFVQEELEEDSANLSGLEDVDFSAFGSLCRQHQAIQAMAFLAWLFLMGYAIALLVSALVARGRGNTEIWTSTVRDTKFLERREADVQMGQYDEEPKPDNY